MSDLHQDNWLLCWKNNAFHIDFPIFEEVSCWVQDIIRRQRNPNWQFGLISLSQYQRCDRKHYRILRRKWGSEQFNCTLVWYLVIPSQCVYSENQWLKINDLVNNAATGWSLNQELRQPQKDHPVLSKCILLWIRSLIYQRR